MLKVNNAFRVVIGDDFESSLLSFEKLDRASPDLWPEQCKFEFLLLLSSYSLLKFVCVCRSNLGSPVILLQCLELQNLLHLVKM